MSPPTIFAIRESPDWAALAADHAAGRMIAPDRYAQPRNVPSFPTDIVELIARWDRFAALPFFACRVELKAIAAATLRRVPGAEVMSFHQAGDRASAAAPFLLFFCDDDDWFAPDLAARLAGIDLAAADAVVFPLARLAVNAFTIARPGTAVRDPIGPVHPFVLRYHTNNYGLTPAAFRKAPATRLIEHRQASDTATAAGFIDAHADTIVSATSKTPCSASLLADVVQDADRFAAYLTHYLATMKRLTIPPAHAWLAEPLWATIRLFERALPRRR